MGGVIWVFTGFGHMALLRCGWLSGKESGHLKEWVVHVVLIKVYSKAGPSEDEGGENYS